MAARDGGNPGGRSSGPGGRGGRTGGRGRGPGSPGSGRSTGPGRGGRGSGAQMGAGAASRSRVRSMGGKDTIVKVPATQNSRRTAGATKLNTVVFDDAIAAAQKKAQAATTAAAKAAAAKAVAKAKADKAAAIAKAKAATNREQGAAASKAAASRAAASRAAAAKAAKDKAAATAREKGAAASRAAAAKAAKDKKAAANREAGRGGSSAGKGSNTGSSGPGGAGGRQKGGKSSGGSNTGSRGPGGRGGRGGRGGGGGGGQGGGSGGCFVANTLVEMLDGSEKRIIDINVGEHTKGGIVEAKMEFIPQSIYNYKDVKVSGSHLVIEDGKFVKVEDSKHGVLTNNVESVYCFETSANRIWVKGIEFGDYLTGSDEQWQPHIDVMLDTINKQIQAVAN